MFQKRKCSTCFVLKDQTDFYGKGRTLHANCKACYNTKRKDYRNRNKQMFSEIDRRARYRYKYGLNIENVPSKGICPICQKAKRLVVDHKHGTTKAYRGFICNMCNIVLGHIENKDKMNRFYAYLEAYEKIQEETQEDREVPIST